MSAVFQGRKTRETPIGRKAKEESERNRNTMAKKWEQLKMLEERIILEEF